MARARSRWDPTTAGLGAASGALAGLAGAALAGGTGPNPLVGALTGLVVGLLGGLAACLVRPASPTSARGGDLTGAVTAGDLLAVAGPAPAASAAPAPAAAPTARPAGNLGALVTSIGHRYQQLADRQLHALDALAPAGGAGGGSGRGDGEADRAQATRLSRRMRRLAKTLEVLADDPDSPEPASPTPMAEVLRAAIADNDEQTRIEYASLHAATVDGEAVADLVHLLAELVDNAVASSRGNGTKVVVLGRRASDGYLLSVVDEGAGMPPGEREAANGRLSSPPPLPQQSPAAFGLPTVGRLAARHGIAVHLLEAATDGLIAKVRIPARLLDGPAPSRPARAGASRGNGGERPANGGEPPANGGERGTGRTARAGTSTVDVIDLADATARSASDATARSASDATAPRASDGAETSAERRRSLADLAPAPEGATAAAAQRAEAARRVVRGGGTGNGAGGGGKRPGDGGRTSGPARGPDGRPGGGR